MKNYFFLFLIVLMGSSCEHSILEKNFYPDYYDADFVKLSTDPKLTQEDVFLINYTIIRQRDFYGYEVEGKTFGELLKLGKQLKADGIQTQQVFDEAPSQDYLTAQVLNQKMTYIQKESNAKRKVKFLKFSTSYHNTSGKDVALNYATFIIKGPFGQHLMTAGYETNCKILPGEKLYVNYILNAKKIRTNLFYGKKHKITRTMIDDVIPRLNIEFGGIGIDTDPTNYDECFLEDMVVEPFKLSEYKEMYPGKKIPVETKDGVNSIYRGPSLFTGDKEEKVLKYN